MKFHVHRKSLVEKEYMKSSCCNSGVYHLERLFSWRTGNGGSKQKDTEAAEPYATGHTSETLLTTNRKEPRSLVPPTYLLSQQAASTQNHALNALVFLYKHVLEKELGSVDAVRAGRPKRLPAVLTQEETRRVLSLLSGVNHLILSLLHGYVDTDRLPKKWAEKHLAESGFEQHFLNLRGIVESCR